MNPLVSICCTTYNHKSFIRDSIEGFLSQKVDFPIEIIIHDDASTDGTSDIIKVYEERHPDLIKAIYQNENKFSKGIKPSLNYVWPNAKGKYIALCEGDDYWIDPLKLQKQVDFLESNQDYAICFHKVYDLKDDKKSLSLLNKSEKEETFTTLDLAEDNFIHTPSVVFKKSVLGELPEWFEKAAAGDYVLHMYSAKFGKIKYMPSPMAVYRLHNGGMWSSKTVGDLFPKWIDLLEMLLSADFSDEVKGVLLVQKKSKVKEYLHWLLDHDEFSLLKKAIDKYFVSNNADLIDFFMQYIHKCKEDLQEIKRSKTFKASKLMSEIKNKIIS